MSRYSAGLSVWVKLIGRSAATACPWVSGFPQIDRSALVDMMGISLLANASISEQGRGNIGYPHGAPTAPVHRGNEHIPSLYV